MTQLEVYQTIAIVIGVIVFVVWIRSQTRKALQRWVEYSESRVKVKLSEKQLMDKANERKRNAKHSSPLYPGRRNPRWIIYAFAERIETRRLKKFLKTNNLNIIPRPIVKGPSDL